MAGDRAKAAGYYRKLVDLARDADTERPELASARKLRDALTSPRPAALGVRPRWPRRLHAAKLGAFGSRVLMVVPQALVFDVFGTVVDWREGVARDLAAFFRRHGVAADPYAAASAWRRRYQPAMEECRAGRRPFTRLDVLHRENLDAVLAEFGVDVRGVEPAELEDLNRAWHRLDPWPDAVAGLLRLKSRYIIAPLSNGNVALLLNMAKRAGLPWDAILGAEVARAYKPRPEAYLRTADLLGLRPGEVCLVAAHNDDLKAARACGLRTAFVPRPTEHGAGQTADLTPSEAWDVVAADFLDLAAHLDA